MQQRRVIWMAALVLGSLGTGCGDDASSGSEGSDAKKDGGSGGEGGRDPSTSSGSRDSGTTGGGSGGDEPGDDPIGPGMDPGSPGSDEDAGLMEDCGAIACEVGMCCADPFASICGAPIGERGCIMPPPPSTTSDARCPELNIMNFFTLPSCCTDMGQCGIDASMFGTGCIELGEFARLAEQMAGASGVMIDIPPPQPCD